MLVAMRRLAAALAALVTAGLASAGVAHADQRSFISMLARSGFPVDQDETREIVQLGYVVCQSLYAGQSEANAVGQIIVGLGNRGADVDPQRAQALVSAAHSQLCPDAR